jgi:hypothetical protein
VKAAFLTLLFSTLALPVIAGPPVLTVDVRSASVAGHYTYEPRNQPAMRGTLDLRLQFIPRPETVNVAPTFGDTDYTVSTVVFEIDGKPQTFPVELLKELGYCSPVSILFWSDGDAAGLLMTIEFSAGADKRVLAFRLLDNSIRPENRK